MTAARTDSLPGAFLASLGAVLVAASSFWQTATAQEPVPDPERGVVRLAIVGPEAWSDELNRYAASRPPGVRCRVITLESITSRGLAGDEAEQVKRALHEAFCQEGLTHALLVGDADIFPVRFMMLDRNTTAAFDTAFYPSDLYYADLLRADGTFEDWNARRDGHHADYFGEVHGEHNKDCAINQDRIHYLPEIAVGRWPVGGLDELRAVIDKSLAFERQSAAGHAGRGKVLLVAVDGWVDCRQQLVDMGRRLPAPWIPVEHIYGWPADGPAATDGAAVVGRLNEGVAIVAHAGHGYPGGWDRSMGTGDLGGLINGTALPVVISAGCSTAAFATLPPYEPYVDHRGAEHAGTNAGEVFTAPPPPPACLQPARLDVGSFGEQMLLHPGSGAVAYIGCNTGSQPCALTLVDGFLRAVADHPGGTIGDCWNGAIRHYWEGERLGELQPDAGWYPPSIFFQGMKFMLFGDPSLRLPPADGMRQGGSGSLP